jgi:hypothetical protein
MGLQVFDGGYRVRVAVRLQERRNQGGLVKNFVGGLHAPDSKAET